MNSFLNPQNGTSLTGIVDITAHSINVIGEKESKNINDIFISKNKISIAEPYDVQIDETGNNFITMYQFKGKITDDRVPGLESLLNYMTENFFSKDEAAVNEHHYHITKKNIMKIYIIFIILIKAERLTLRIIDIQTNIITIRNNT